MRNKSIVFICLLFITFSCSNEKVVQKHVMTQGSTLNDKWKGSSILGLLDSIGIDSIEKYNFLVVLDANCGSCFGELEVWRKRIVPKLGNNGLKYHFVLLSNDKKVTKFLLKERDYKDFIFNFDDKDIIKHNLPFMLEDKVYNALLFDKNGLVHTVGSPLVLENLFNYYVEVIKK